MLVPSIQRPEAQWKVKDRPRGPWGRLHAHGDKLAPKPHPSELGPVPRRRRLHWETSQLLPAGKCLSVATNGALRVQDAVGREGHL